MALINCPECGRENVSDSAESCPQCGYNIKAHFARMRTSDVMQTVKSEMIEKPKKNIKWFIKKNVALVIILVIVLSALLALFVFRQIYKNSPASRITSKTTYAGLLLSYGIPSKKDTYYYTWESINFYGLDGELKVHFNDKRIIGYSWICIIPSTDSWYDYEDERQKISDNLEKLTGDYRKGRNIWNGVYIPDDSSDYPKFEISQIDYDTMLLQCFFNTGQ